MKQAATLSYELKHLQDVTLPKLKSAKGFKEKAPIIGQLEQDVEYLYQEHLSYDEQGAYIQQVVSAIVHEMKEETNPKHRIEYLNSLKNVWYNVGVHTHIYPKHAIPSANAMIGPVMDVVKDTPDEYKPVAIEIAAYCVSNAYDAVQSTKGLTFTPPYYEDITFIQNYYNGMPLLISSISNTEEGAEARKAAQHAATDIMHLEFFQYLSEDTLRDNGALAVDVQDTKQLEKNLRNMNHFLKDKDVTVKEKFLKEIETQLPSLSLSDNLTPNQAMLSTAYINLRQQLNNDK